VEGRRPAARTSVNLFGGLGIAGAFATLGDSVRRAGRAAPRQTEFPLPRRGRGLPLNCISNPAVGGYCSGMALVRILVDGYSLLAWLAGTGAGKPRYSQRRAMN